MAPSLDAAQWQPRLDLLAREHGVPGAAFGVLRLDDDHDDGTGARLELATGVLHLGTGVPVTPDALFQVGSITKVWTTTLVMRLVDEGLLDLDAPVVERLPAFAVADGDAAAGITLRHLLTHTSGFDGDTFTDTGRGDDCLRAFVAVLTDSRQLFAPGTAWSYNNAAFVVAGRLVETVTGGTWDAALRERVIEPLRLGRTVTLPEEVLLHGAALGHIDDADGRPVPAPVWALPRSCGPAGTVTSTVGDQLTFAAAHLRGGVLDGGRLLSADSAAAMTSQQVARVDTAGQEDASSWGLGWALGTWGGARVVGHNGNTIGQSAFLRLLPEHGLATVLLTNGGRADQLHRALVGEPLVAELGGQLDVVAAAGDGLADQLLVREGAVHVGGVEERHAEVEGPVDGGDRLGLVAAAVELRHAHAAEAEGGDGEWGGGPEGPGSDVCGHVVESTASSALEVNPARSSLST